jgi:hypothetical protein
MMKNKAFFLLLAASSFLMAFSQINLTGKWVGQLVRPHSTDWATFVYDLQQTNNTLTGTLIGPDGGGVAIDSGKVIGYAFSFIITEAYGQAKITGTYYTDSLTSNVALPNGHLLHLTLLRA